jgi:hypothetical protein
VIENVTAPVIAEAPNAARIAASVGERLTGASSPETGLCARR